MSNSGDTLTISGNITEKASISDFDTANGGSVFGNLDIPFVLKISNEGNVYIKPQGKIEIYFTPAVNYPSISAIEIIPE